jgi:hypothetical protein
MAPLNMIPLLLADPDLPEETKLSLGETPDEARGALVELGLSWEEADELVGTCDDADLS